MFTSTFFCFADWRPIFHAVYRHSILNDFKAATSIIIFLVVIFLCVYLLFRHIQSIQGCFGFFNKLYTPSSGQKEFCFSTVLRSLVGKDGPSFNVD